MDKKETVVLVTNNTLPMFKENGSAVYLWTIVNSLIRKEYEVHLICYNFSFSHWAKILNCSDQEIIRSIGLPEIIFHLIPPYDTSKKRATDRITFQRILFPEISDFYKSFYISNTVNEKILEVDPDIVIAYTPDAIVAAGNLPGKKYRLIGLIVDLDHLVRKYRIRYSSNYSIDRLVTRFRKSILSLGMAKLEIKILNNCDKIVCSADHHSKWLQRKGVKNVRYFPVSVLDRFDEKWNIENKRNNPPIIAMIGNVGTTVTLEGLYYFSKHILPSLNKVQSILGFELRLYGGGELADGLARSFQKYPWIKRVGFVENISEAFYTSSIVLVPTSIPLGFRTRIAEAFSYGCCVIAHESNALGMPELMNGKNILLARSGIEITRKIQECLSDEYFRLQVGKNARETFINKYDGQLIADDIIKFCLE